MACSCRPLNPSRCCSADWSHTPPTLLSQRSDFLSERDGLTTRHRQRPDPAQHVAEQPAVQMPLGQQQPVIPRVLDQPTAGLHQSVLQARQRPALDPVRQSEPSPQVAQVVGQHAQLQSHFVGPKTMARKPRPVCGLLAFFNPLLGRAALVVEAHHRPTRQRHVRHDKTDAREQLTEMMLDLGLGEQGGLEGRPCPEQPRLPAISPLLPPCDERIHRRGTPGTEELGELVDDGVNDKGKPFKVGSSYTFVVPSDGFLHFSVNDLVCLEGQPEETMNDRSFSDNGGRFAVMLWIEGRYLRLTG